MKHRIKKKAKFCFLVRLWGILHGTLHPLWTKGRLTIIVINNFVSALTCTQLDPPSFSEVKGLCYIKNRISVFMSTPQGFWKRFTHEDQSNADTKRGSGSLEPIFATCCQFWNHTRLLASPFLEAKLEYVRTYMRRIYIYITLHVGFYKFNACSDTLIE
jgi:hypothetical protein